MGKEPYSWDKSSMFGNKNINPVEHGVQKPIIAALDGNVNGAGFFLALMADIRVATRETLFGLTEVRLNFPVEFTALLPRYLPVGVAMEMLITARRQSAERFYELGIINSLVERDALMTEAESYARDICAGSPMAISVMKELMHRSYDHDYNGMMKLSASMVTPVVNSQDTTEALQAFLQKRKPVWKGK
jgi:enoyl-CoA hydratase/carnithine racemase